MEFLRRNTGLIVLFLLLQFMLMYVVWPSFLDPDLGTLLFQCFIFGMPSYYLEHERKPVWDQAAVKIIIKYDLFYSGFGGLGFVVFAAGV